MPAEAHHWVIATRRHAPPRRATIANVAREAGVNKGTVSRALRGIRGVGANTQQRIIATAGRLDFSASNLATVLAGGRSRTVGIVLLTLRSWYFNEFAACSASSAPDTAATPCCSPARSPSTSPAPARTRLAFRPWRPVPR